MFYSCLTDQWNLSVCKGEQRTQGTWACSLSEESQSYYTCWQSSRLSFFLVKELTFVKEKIYRQYTCGVLVSKGNLSVYPQSSMTDCCDPMVSSPVTSNHLPLLANNQINKFLMEMQKKKKKDEKWISINNAQS